MKILCKICGQEIAANTTNQLIDRLMHHLSRRHKEKAGELATMIAAASGYLAMRRYAVIPDAESTMHLWLGEIEKALFDIMAVDPNLQN